MHRREHENLMVELTFPAIIFCMVQMSMKTGYEKKLNKVKEI